MRTTATDFRRIAMDEKTTFLKRMITPEFIGIVTVMLAFGGIMMGSQRDALGRLESHMGRLESHMDRLGSRMDRFENRMDRFEGRMDRLDDRMGRLEESQALIRERITRLEILVVERLAGPVES